jgi:hypothetical protein
MEVVEDEALAPVIRAAIDLRGGLAEADVDSRLRFYLCFELPMLLNTFFLVGSRLEVVDKTRWGCGRSNKAGSQCRLTDGSDEAGLLVGSHLSPLRFKL